MGARPRLCRIHLQGSFPPRGSPHPFPDEDEPAPALTKPGLSLPLGPGAGPGAAAAPPDSGPPGPPLAPRAAGRRGRCLVSAGNSGCAPSASDPSPALPRASSHLQRSCAVLARALSSLHPFPRELCTHARVNSAHTRPHMHTQSHCHQPQSRHIKPTTLPVGKAQQCTPQAATGHTHCRPRPLRQPVQAGSWLRLGRPAQGRWPERAVR